MTFRIRADDLTSEPTRELLRLHLAGMHASSPPGQVFALDLSGLQAPSVAVYSAWDGESIAGIGALKVLDAATGELKSMRTHPRYLRRGVGALLLDHLIEQARAQGLERLCLETGSGTAFEPAVALYARRGFEAGDAFADYVKSDFNQFFHLRLSPASGVLPPASSETPGNRS